MLKNKGFDTFLVSLFSIFVISVTVLPPKYASVVVVVNAQEVNATADPTTATTTTVNDDDGKSCSLPLSDGTMQTFNVGESFGDLIQTRCKNPIDYPCYCNPPNGGGSGSGSNDDAMIYCPYCGFATNEGVLYCAKDGETITFPDGSITRECSCEIPVEYPLRDPVRTCTVLGGVDGIGGGGGGTVVRNYDISISEDGLSCVYKYPDGTEFVFFDGESFSSLVDGACGTGDEYPAFCSTTLSAEPESGTTTAVRQGEEETGGSDGGNDNIFSTTTSPNGISPYVNYPYCIFAETNDNVVKCARDQEDVTFVDKNSKQMKCSCELDATTALPLSFCEEQPFVLTNDSCMYTFPDGVEFEFFIGESFASLVEGPCGSGEDWPAFCRAAEIVLGDTATNNPTSGSETDTTNSTDSNSVGLFYNDPTVLYPYCIYETFSGDVVCGKDQEEVSFQDDAGDDVTCTCTVNEQTGISESSCAPAGRRPTGPRPSPSSATDAPTVLPTKQPKKSAAGTTTSFNMHRQPIAAVAVLVTSSLIVNQLLSL